MQTLIVDANGSGDFTTIQDAIDAVPEHRSEPVTIRIKAGVYSEKIWIEKPNIRLVGEGAGNTILTYGDAANDMMPDGEKRGTFRSYSIFIGADDVVAEHLTFANSAGDGRKVGQALAAYVDADRVAFYQCRFLGHQDTLFTGPLPPAAIQPKGFVGPREHAVRRPVRQYYTDCYIEGDVDFLFGSATAVFERCEIVSLDRQSDPNGYITAASTPEGVPFGYVFHRCRLSSPAAPDSVYLGRPWRNYARTAFLNCWMGAHIKAEGWHNWNKLDAEQTVVYAEYRNTGPGAKMESRVAWANILTDDEAQHYATSHVLGGEDRWHPQNVNVSIP
jgi:pectinesterase